MSNIGVILSLIWRPRS